MNKYMLENFKFLNIEGKFMGGGDSRDACGFDPWVGKIPWKRKCNPLQYSCLGNPMDRGA